MSTTPTNVDQWNRFILFPLQFRFSLGRCRSRGGCDYSTDPSYAPPTSCVLRPAPEVLMLKFESTVFPSTIEALKILLPASGGHLAPIAAWADRVRGIPALSWTGQLHYTSPTNDHPPELCTFGEQGWKTDHDVLHAISNFTRRLIDNPKE